MKLVMAVSGALFVLYVIAHMYGNLKVFGWAIQAFDDYSEHLRSLRRADPAVLRVSSGSCGILLIVALIAHVYSAFYLWSRAQGARTTRYAVKKAVAATISARFMRWGAWRCCSSWRSTCCSSRRTRSGQNGDYPSPYQRVVAGFQVWWVVLIYVIAMVALGMHLRHGIWSAAQTLGWTSSARARGTANTLAIIVATVVVVGFLLPPVSILIGFVK